MAYWIQESDCSKYSRRMYNCDFRADVAGLPTNTRLGDVDRADCPEAADYAHYGDRCLCLEDTSVYELRKETDDWKEL